MHVIETTECNRNYWNVRFDLILVGLAWYGPFYIYLYVMQSNQSAQNTMVSRDNNILKLNWFHFVYMYFILCSCDCIRAALYWWAYSFNFCYSVLFALKMLFQQCIMYNKNIISVVYSYVFVYFMSVCLIFRFVAEVFLCHNFI